jgi:hypothetical protein
MLDNSDSPTARNLDHLVQTAVQNAMRQVTFKFIVYLLSGFGLQFMLVAFLAGGYTKAVDSLEQDMLNVITWKESTIQQLATLNSSVVNLSTNLVDLTGLLRLMQQGSDGN